MVSPSQVEAQSAHGQETQRADRHAAHNVHALRGAALQQGDIIADLRARLRCNEVRDNASLQMKRNDVYCDLLDQLPFGLETCTHRPFFGLHEVGATCATTVAEVCAWLLLHSYHITGRITLLMTPPSR